MPWPNWNNPTIELFHGTLEQHADAMKRDGINPFLGRTNTDFGQGFYTTTWLDQARNWAADMALKRRGVPAVVKLSIDRLALRSLRSLAFVRGTSDAADLWSFVEHCRNHSNQAPVTGEYHDVVYGPVAFRWGPDEYETFSEMDQISFHGDNALRFLRRPDCCTVEVMK